MTIKSLAEELEIIDQTMAELDDRRTAIINQMANSSEPHDLPSNVLRFPARVTVKSPPRSSDGGWPPGSDATTPDLE
jgi:hypothetical protein